MRRLAAAFQNSRRLADGKHRFNSRHIQTPVKSDGKPSQSKSPPCPPKNTSLSAAIALQARSFVAGLLADGAEAVGISRLPEADPVFLPYKSGGEHGAGSTEQGVRPASPAPCSLLPARSPFVVWT